MSLQQDFLLETYVAGFRFTEGPKIISEMKVEDPITLAAQPENVYDKNAVCVFFNKQRIGFIPRVRNLALAQALARGERFKAKIVLVQPLQDPHRAVKIGVFK